MSSSRVRSTPRSDGRLRRLLPLLLGALLGVAGLAVVPAPAFAAPANDNFANPQVLTGAPVTVTGSNAAATKETGEPKLADNNGGKSIWYSWTAPDYGSVDVDLAGSSFDTLLGIYTGESVADLTLIGSVDDTPSGARQGRISFPVVAGTTYRIAVDGYDGVSGSVQLALDFGIATTGVISGQVVDGQQAGLGLVCVAVYGEDGAGAGYAVTDGAGRYRVNELVPGDYRVGFNDCGSGIVEEFYPDSETYELAQPVTVVVARETVVDAEVAFADEPSTDQPVVSGRVTDTAGNPLAGVCVNITQDQTGNTWQVRTDGDGRYQADVNPGLYITQFTSCGDQPYVMDQWYDGATYETADVFMASMGRETTGIDARMVFGGRVRGTVTDDDGVGLELVCVDLLDATGEPVVQSVVTYTGGNYGFENVLPGTYFVGFRNCRAIGPFADEFYEDADTFAEATPVVVPAGGTVAADGVLERVTPPDTVIVTGPAEGATVASTTATFTFAGDPAEDAVSFMCQIDSRTWAVCTNPKSFTNLSQGQHTFRVYAVGRGGVEDQTEAERTFRVDTSPPNTFLDSGPAAGATLTTNAATFTFRGTAGDTAKLQCQLDTAEWADCTSPLSLTDLGEGSHTMRIRAQDAVGNQDQSPISRAFAVDTVAPDTTIDSGPTGAVPANAVTFEFHGTAADTAKIQCQVDGAAWADCTSMLELTGLAEGDHTVAFRAQDAVGNQDQSPATRSFTVDTVVPDTTIDSGPTGVVATDEATFEFHGTEGDTAMLQCRLDDGDWADCASPVTFDELAEGDHTVAFRAFDAAGNQDQTPATREFTVDTEAPDTVVDSGPTGVVATDKATFEFHGTEGDTATLQCRVDDEDWAPCTSPLELTDLAEGDHTVAFRAQDAAGNQDQTPASRSFTVDTVAPDTTIDSGPTGVIAADEATYVFHGTEGDTATLQCRVDDGDWADCASPATFDELAEGDHTVAFRAVDAAGNQDQTPATRSFTVDTVAPDSVVDSGPTGLVAADEATYAFHGTAGDTEKIQCRVDEAAWTDCTSPATFTDLAEGDHTVSFRAQDAAGNQDQTPATRSVTVDTVAPDTTIDSGPTAGATITTRSTSFAFHGTAGDTARLQCRTDGGAWADCTSPATLADLADGSHGVEFRAIDAAGNIDASPAARTFLVQVPVVVVPGQPQASTQLVLDAPRKVKAGKKAKFRVKLIGVGTGTVVIRDGRKVVRTVTVKGRATVKLRLKPGKHRLSASYAGSATAKPATSKVRTIVVKRAKRG